MKKIVLILLLLLSLVACGKKETGENVKSLINEGYNIECSTFDENSWRGLFTKDKEYLIVTSKMDKKSFEEANEIFFEEDKYDEFVNELVIESKEDITSKLPTLDDLQKYVGKTFGELEDEGFENTGYCESDNYQYNFNYENNEICLIVKSGADTPIKNIDDFSVNDIKQLKVAEIVDYYVSSNILYSD